METLRRSRHSTTPVTDEPHVIEHPTARDRELFDILYWHRFLPTTWLHAHFPDADYTDLRKRCGHLKEDQNAYLHWSDPPLNSKLGNSRHGVYELSGKGAKAIERTLPRYSRHELAHEFTISLHECSLKLQARANSVPFSFLDPTEYQLGSATWVPDGHPIIIGEPGHEILIHSEIERRHYAESKKKTEQKLEKAYAYIKDRRYESDANSGLVLFLSTNPGRTETLKRYVKERFGPTTFFGFGTTKDWVNEPSYPKPQEPLVSEWEREGHSPLKLI